MVNYIVDIQLACSETIPVSNEILQQWVELTLTPYRPRAELTIRLVSPEEMTTLNNTYRKQNKTTNVLAFPADYPSDIALDHPFLGDVIICPTVLDAEAKKLKTPLEHHWAHIVIHGVLHLLGYDHIIKEEANVMRAIEIDRLQRLGFDNPYLSEEYALD